LKNSGDNSSKAYIRLIQGYKKKRGVFKMKLEILKLLKEIRGYFNEKNMQALKDTMNSLESFKVADILEILEPEKQVAAFRVLSKEKALDVFENLETYVQQSLLQSFTDEKSIEFFSSLEPDDRIRLLDELPAGVAKRLLSTLSPYERDLTSILLGYTDGTAGNIMTPKYVRLSKDMTVAQSIERIRSTGKNMETINQLYVTDEGRKLEGVVSLSDLIMSGPEAKVSDIMTVNPVKVNTDTKEETVAGILKDSDLIAVPVVDFEERLVGVVTVDDAIDILEDEATDAAYDKVGFIDLNKNETDRSRVLIDGSIFQVWKVRIPFLIITLIGGMLAGGLISFFENSLDAVVAVAFFVPVIMDMGGNVGTQSSTIFTRALVLGQIDPETFIRKWLREILIGLSIGVLLGFAGGMIAYLWQGVLTLGIVVGVSLCFTITLATGLGFLIPFILVKLGFDQAAGSDPIITTIKDISGLAIYFLLVSAFLM